MAKLDDVLHAVAEKVDKAADRIDSELKRLEQEVQQGRPSPEAVQRVRQSVDRLHGIVPETEAEAEAEVEGGTEAEADEDTGFAGGGEVPHHE